MVPKHLVPGREFKRPPPKLVSITRSEAHLISVVHLKAAKKGGRRELISSGFDVLMLQPLVNLMLRASSSKVSHTMQMTMDDRTAVCGSVCSLAFVVIGDLQARLIKIC